MTETAGRDPGQDPAPLRHADAERVTSREAERVPDGATADTEEREKNPKTESSDGTRRAVKGP